MAGLALRLFEMWKLHNSIAPPLSFLQSSFFLNEPCLQSALKFNGFQKLIALCNGLLDAALTRVCVGGLQTRCTLSRKAPMLSYPLTCLN